MLSFLRILQARISTKNVSGILSIGQVAQQSWSLGVSAFLKIMAIISINLFVFEFTSHSRSGRGTSFDLYPGGHQGSPLETSHHPSGPTGGLSYYSLSYGLFPL